VHTHLHLYSAAVTAAVAAAAAQEAARTLASGDLALPARAANVYGRCVRQIIHFIYTKQSLFSVENVQKLYMPTTLASLRHRSAILWRGRAQIFGRDFLTVAQYSSAASTTAAVTVNISVRSIKILIWMQ
jgi:hypothetical protein